MSSIDYKTALITGGSHRIGGNISARLAAENWSVAIHYHGSALEAEELAQSIVSDGGEAIVVGADLSNFESVSHLLSQTTRELGPIGALINNASIFETEEWDDVSLESWTAHLDINLRAPFFLSQAFARQLPESSRGAIINIIDQRVWNLTPHFMSYTVSKSGLWTMTQTLAMALAPRIRVNGVGPGPTLANKRQNEQAFRQQCEAMPLEHGVAPSDIADAVLYLLDARSVTGQMIAVDSGEHLGWAQPSQTRSIDE
jgi:NAD(P)-dependent dehydrogenase (short-subunit alcohol dehydrogenase family)